MGIDIKPIIKNWQKTYYKAPSGTVHLNDIPDIQYHSDKVDYTMINYEETPKIKEQLEKDIKFGNTGLIFGLSVGESVALTFLRVRDFGYNTNAVISRVFTTALDAYGEALYKSTGIEALRTNYTQKLDERIAQNQYSDKFKKHVTAVYNDQTNPIGFIHGNTYNPELTRKAGNLLGECLVDGKRAKILGISDRLLYGANEGAKVTVTAISNGKPLQQPCC